MDSMSTFIVFYKKWHNTTADCVRVLQALGFDDLDDLATALRIGRRSLKRACCSPCHIEFKSPADCDIGFSSIGILGSHEANSIYAINEKTAAGSVLVLHHPIAMTVLTHHKQRNWLTRRRFGFSHLLHLNSP
jgi:hypothetical protein